MSGARPPVTVVGSWLVPALVAAAGGYWRQRLPDALVDPISCPGLFEYLAIVATRTDRTVILADVLVPLDGVLLVLALFWATRLLYAISNNAAASTAGGLLLAMSPAVASPWSPSASAALMTLALLGAWVVSSAQRHLQLGWVPASLALATVALAPPLALPMIVSACLIVFWPTPGVREIRAGLRVALLALALVALPFVLLVALRHSTPVACLIPPDLSEALAGVPARMTDAVVVSPLAALLAVGGWLAFALRHRDRHVVLVLAAVLVVGGSVLGGSSQAAMAPWLLGWAMGITQGVMVTAEGISNPRLRRVGTMTFSLVLILTTAGTRTEMASEQMSDRAPAGHQDLSWSDFQDLVSAIPDDGVLVDEDALVAYLALSMPSRTRQRVRLEGLPVEASAITAALEHQRVFALPRTQRRLRALGFRLEPVTGPMTGLAEVFPAWPCADGAVARPSDVATGDQTVPCPESHFELVDIGRAAPRS